MYLRPRKFENNLTFTVLLKKSAWNSILFDVIAHLFAAARSKVVNGNEPEQINHCVREGLSTTRFLVKMAQTLLTKTHIYIYNICEEA